MWRSEVGGPRGEERERTRLESLRRLSVRLMQERNVVEERVESKMNVRDSSAAACRFLHRTERRVRPRPDSFRASAMLGELL
jgi:hypothetical protein